MAKAEKEIPVHYDFLKRPLSIGDSVILIKPHYRELLLARVERFTPTKVNVRWGASDYDTLRQDSYQLCKIDGPDLTAYLLKK
jgi:hypothetical protein